MSCCDGGCAPPSNHDRGQRTVLWAVLAINVLVFLGEFGTGLWAGSTALQSDSLDSLGDAIIYGVSLAVVGASLRARSRAALLKGWVQLLFAAFVLVEVARAVTHGAHPITQLMVAAAALAFVANGTCMGLLSRFRDHDLNMRSVWLCSRNDVISNAAVLVTAGLINVTGWGWLDPLFGGGVALLFTVTGIKVIRASQQELARLAGPSGA